MTADDFFLLFIAFGGFVIAPALMLWGFARITQRTQDGKRGPDIRPDVDSPGSSNGDGQKEAARSGRANDFLRRLADWTDTVRRRMEHPTVSPTRKPKKHGRGDEDRDLPMLSRLKSAKPMHSGP